MALSPLDLPDLFHIGWVVRDCGAAAEELHLRLGAGPFHHISEASRFEHALLHGEVRPFSLKIAFETLGGVLLELLEPLDDRSPHAEFLRHKGEGLHHLAYLVSDVDGQINRARDETPSLELLVDGTGPGNPVRWAYLEGDVVHGAVIELIERSPLAEELFRDVLALVGHGLRKPS